MFSRRILKIILTSVFFAGGFLFLNAETVSAQAGHLVISEIQAAGATADDEFIEIYNPTASAVNLESWSIQYKSAVGSSFSKKNFPAGARIPARGWYLIARAGYAGASAADMSHGTFSLAGSGGNVFLVNNQILLTSASDPSIVDKVAYGTGDSPEAVAAPAPPAGQSLERKPGAENGNGEDADDNSADFILQSAPNPKNTTSPPQPPPDDAPPAEPPADESTEIPAPPISSENHSSAPAVDPAPTSNCLNNVIVNELLISPEDGGNGAEFIELYNQSGQEVDLSGWVLEDTQGKVKAFVIPGGVKIGPLGFRVFYGSETKITLNNSGDGVRLFDAGKNWCDNSPLNSGAAKEGFSYSREGGKWFWAAAVTPEAKNEVSPEKETVRVAEVIDGDTIKLADGRKVRYIGVNAPELRQYNKPAECFSEQAMEKNKELVLNKEIVLEKDVSETDNYGRFLRYAHIKDVFVNDYLAREGFVFSSPYPPDNKYQSRLAEAQQSAQANNKGLWQFCREREIKEMAAGQSIDPASESLKGEPAVVLNEFLPNPVGADAENEFIELKNFGAEKIGLEKWRLEDASGKKYVFSSSTLIGPGGFLVLWRKATNISLNNNRETLKMFSPDGKIIDEVSFNEPAMGGASFNRLFPTSTVWLWSKVPSPGADNMIIQINKPPSIIFETPNVVSVGEEIFFDASDSVDPENDFLSFLWSFGDKTQSFGATTTHRYERAGKMKITLTVSDGQGNETKEKAVVTVIDDENALDKKDVPSSVNQSGKRFQVVGQVTVPPGIFGSQIFYLMDEDGRGWQIYMFKKDFPELPVGARVAVGGELSAIQSFSRLKIKQKSDTAVLSPDPPFSPETEEIGGLAKEKIGGLVKIAGEVLETKSGQFYLADDSGEILVQLKSSAGFRGAPPVKEGDMAEVTGILARSGDDFRIWPRFSEDIKILSAAEIAGAESTGGKTTDKYLTATAGGLTSLLLAFLARGRGALARTVALGAVSRAMFWKRKKE